jgi:Ca2+-transporting ATPase
VDSTHLPAWHALGAESVVEQLGSDAAGGLTVAEAARRRFECGDNILLERPAEGWWWKLLRQFQELVIWILLVAAVIAGAIGDWADTAAIVAIVFVNAIIGFLQEERALAALAALQRMTAPVAKVIRGGEVRSTPAKEIVPGDMLDLEAGDAVPADARLVESFCLRVQESALTGESEPVEKDALAKVPEAAALGDKRTMVHAGTVVAAGHARALVVATGMNTELGRIATLLETTGPEMTPLQRRLAELGRVLIVVCLAVVGVIFSLEVWRDGGLATMWAEGLFGDVLLRAVSLAVAAVPEGLPAVVTVVLAIGLQRMVKRNALVRRLPSVETLGCVTVICSDKTGTLTRNEMTVREVVTAGGSWQVTGVGYSPQGEFRPTAPTSGGPSPGPIQPHQHPDLDRLLQIAVRCNNAAVQPGGQSGAWRVVGDPTEGALVVAALKGGVSRNDPAEPVVFEIPFDSERKRMSVVVQLADGSRVLETKGATEAVLPWCVAEYRDGRNVPLSEERRTEILVTAETLADRALRVLSLACRSLEAGESVEQAPDSAERHLVHVGLAGMIDPPRDEVKHAVATCRSAGIRPVMITGDHPATALAIGRELGIVEAAGRAVTGAELERLDDAALAALVPNVAVYARVSAEDKLRIVRAWQADGAVVAMTGDGVNDAPAVRAADIGIAMGVTGTDVTKEASDMVLTDDNFTSIVAAIEEGRSIYDNIQKFIHYLLSCNAGEVLVMLVAALVGWPAPLAAIQILWLNLVTDGLPALALGLEPPEADIMQRAPRPPHEPVITLARGTLIVAHGVIVAASSLGAFWWAWGGDPARLSHARTVTFCVAAFSQLFFAFGCRSDRQTAVALGLLSNPWLLAAVLVSALLQLIVVTLPYAQGVFEVGSHPGRDWVLVLGLALAPVTLIELSKWVISPGLVTSTRRP